MLRWRGQHGGGFAGSQRMFSYLNEIWKSNLHDDTEEELSIKDQWTIYTDYRIVISLDVSRSLARVVEDDGNVLLDRLYDSLDRILHLLFVSPGLGTADIREVHLTIIAQGDAVHHQQILCHGLRIPASVSPEQISKLQRFFRERLYVVEWQSWQRVKQNSPMPSVRTQNMHLSTAVSSLVPLLDDLPRHAAPIVILLTDSVGEQLLGRSALRTRSGQHQPSENKVLQNVNVLTSLTVRDVSLSVVDLSGDMEHSAILGYVSDREMFTWLAERTGSRLISYKQLMRKNPDGIAPVRSSKVSEDMNSAMWPWARRTTLEAYLTHTHTTKRMVPSSRGAFSVVDSYQPSLELPASSEAQRTVQVQIESYVLMGTPWFDLIDSRVSAGFRADDWSIIKYKSGNSVYVTLYNKCFKRIHLCYLFHSINLDLHSISRSDMYLSDESMGLDVSDCAMSASIAEEYFDDDTTYESAETEVLVKLYLRAEQSFLDEYYAQLELRNRQKSDSDVIYRNVMKEKLGVLHENADSQCSPLVHYVSKLVLQIKRQDQLLSRWWDLKRAFETKSGKYVREMQSTRFEFENGDGQRGNSGKSGSVDPYALVSTSELVKTCIEQVDLRRLCRQLLQHSNLLTCDFVDVFFPDGASSGVPGTLHLDHSAKDIANVLSELSHTRLVSMQQHKHGESKSRRGSFQGSDHEEYEARSRSSSFQKPNIVVEDDLGDVDGFEHPSTRGVSNSYYVRLYMKPIYSSDSDELEDSPPVERWRLHGLSILKVDTLSPSLCRVYAMSFRCSQQDKDWLFNTLRFRLREAGVRILDSSLLPAVMLMPKLPHPHDWLRSQSHEISPGLQSKPALPPNVSLRMDVGGIPGVYSESQPGGKHLKDLASAVDIWAPVADPASMLGYCMRFRWVWTCPADLQSTVLPEVVHAIGSTWTETLGTVSVASNDGGLHDPLARSFLFYRSLSIRAGSNDNSADELGTTFSTTGMVLALTRTVSDGPKILLDIVFEPRFGYPVDEDITTLIDLHPPYAASIATALSGREFGCVFPATMSSSSDIVPSTWMRSLARAVYTNSVAIISSVVSFSRLAVASTGNYSPSWRSQHKRTGSELSTAGAIAHDFASGLSGGQAPDDAHGLDAACVLDDGELNVGHLLLMNSLGKRLPTLLFDLTRFLKRCPVVQVRLDVPVGVSPYAIVQSLSGVLHGIFEPFELNSSISSDCYFAHVLDINTMIVLSVPFPLPEKYIGVDIHYLHRTFVSNAAFVASLMNPLPATLQDDLPLSGFLHDHRIASLVSYVVTAYEQFCALSMLPRSIRGGEMDGTVLESLLTKSATEYTLRLDFSRYVPFLPVCSSHELSKVVTGALLRSGNWSVVPGSQYFQYNGSNGAAELGQWDDASVSKPTISETTYDSEEDLEDEPGGSSTDTSGSDVELKLSEPSSPALKMGQMAPSAIATEHPKLATRTARGLKRTDGSRQVPIPVWMSMECVLQFGTSAADGAEGTGVSSRDRSNTEVDTVDAMQSSAVEKVVPIPMSGGANGTDDIDDISDNDCIHCTLDLKFVSYRGLWWKMISGLDWGSQNAHWDVSSMPSVDAYIGVVEGSGKASNPRDSLAHDDEFGVKSLVDLSPTKRSHLCLPNSENTQALVAWGSMVSMFTDLAFSAASGDSLDDSSGTHKEAPELSDSFLQRSAPIHILPDQMVKWQQAIRHSLEIEVARVVLRTCMERARRVDESLVASVLHEFSSVFSGTREYEKVDEPLRFLREQASEGVHLFAQALTTAADKEGWVCTHAGRDYVMVPKVCFGAEDAVDNDADLQVPPHPEKRELRRGLPFWVSLSVFQGMASLFVYDPVTNDHAPLVEKARSVVQSALHRANQMLLLHDMNETRGVSLTTLEQYACACVYQYRLPIYHRLQSEYVMRTVMGTTLAQFMLYTGDDENHLLIHRDTNGDIYYFVLDICPLENDDDEELIVSYPESILAPRGDWPPGHQNTSKAMKVCKPEADARSNSPVPGLSAKQRSCLRLCAFGLEKPRGDGVEILIRFLRHRVFVTTVTTVSNILFRNPQMKLLPLDILYIRTAVHTYAAPDALLTNSGLSSALQSRAMSPAPDVGVSDDDSSSGYQVLRWRAKGVRDVDYCVSTLRQHMLDLFRAAQVLQQTEGFLQPSDPGYGMCNLHLLSFYYNHGQQQILSLKSFSSSSLPSAAIQNNLTAARGGISGLAFIQWSVLDSEFRKPWAWSGEPDGEEMGGRDMDEMGPGVPVVEIDRVDDGGFDVGFECSVWKFGNVKLSALAGVLSDLLHISLYEAHLEAAILPELKVTQPNAWHIDSALTPYFDLITKKETSGLCTEISHEMLIPPWLAPSFARSVAQITRGIVPSLCPRLCSDSSKGIDDSMASLASIDSPLQELNVSDDPDRRIHVIPNEQLDEWIEGGFKWKPQKIYFLCGLDELIPGYGIAEENDGETSAVSDGGINDRKVIAEHYARDLLFSGDNDDSSKEEYRPSFLFGSISSEKFSLWAYNISPILVAYLKLEIARLSSWSQSRALLMNGILNQKLGFQSFGYKIHSLFGSENVRGSDIPGAFDFSGLPIDVLLNQVRPDPLPLETAVHAVATIIEGLLGEPEQGRGHDTVDPNTVSLVRKVLMVRVKVGGVSQPTMQNIPPGGGGEEDQPSSRKSLQQWMMSSSSPFAQLGAGVSGVPISKSRMSQSVSEVHSTLSTPKSRTPEMSRRSSMRSVFTQKAIGTASRYGHSDSSLTTSRRQPSDTCSRHVLDAIGEEAFAWPHHYSSADMLGEHGALFARAIMSHEKASLGRSTASTGKSRSGQRTHPLLLLSTSSCGIPWKLHLLSAKDVRDEQERSPGHGENSGRSLHDHAGPGKKRRGFFTERFKRTKTAPPAVIADAVAGEKKSRGEKYATKNHKSKIRKSLADNTSHSSSNLSIDTIDSSQMDSSAAELSMSESQMGASTPVRADSARSNASRGSAFGAKSVFPASSERQQTVDFDELRSGRADMIRECETMFSEFMGFVTRKLVKLSLDGPSSRRTNQATGVLSDWRSLWSISRSRLSTTADLLAETDILSNTDDDVTVGPTIAIRNDILEKWRLYMPTLRGRIMVHSLCSEDRSVDGLSTAPSSEKSMDYAVRRDGVCEIVLENRRLAMRHWAGKGYEVANNVNTVENGHSNGSETAGNSRDSDDHSICVPDLWSLCTLVQAESFLYDYTLKRLMQYLVDDTIPFAVHGKVLDRFDEMHNGINDGVPRGHLNRYYRRNVNIDCRCLLGMVNEYLDYIATNSARYGLHWAGAVHSEHSDLVYYARVLDTSSPSVQPRRVRRMSEARKHKPQISGGGEGGAVDVDPSIRSAHNESLRGHKSSAFGGMESHPRATTIFVVVSLGKEKTAVNRDESHRSSVEDLTLSPVDSSLSTDPRSRPSRTPSVPASPVDVRRKSPRPSTGPMKTPSSARRQKPSASGSPVSWTSSVDGERDRPAPSQTVSIPQQARRQPSLSVSAESETHAAGVPVVSIDFTFHVVVLPGETDDLMMCAVDGGDRSPTEDIASEDEAVESAVSYVANCIQTALSSQAQTEFRVEQLWGMMQSPSTCSLDILEALKELCPLTPLEDYDPSLSRQISGLYTNWRRLCDSIRGAYESRAVVISADDCDVVACVVFDRAPSNFCVVVEHRGMANRTVVYVVEKAVQLGYSRKQHAQSTRVTPVRPGLLSTPHQPQNETPAYEDLLENVVDVMLRCVVQGLVEQLVIEAPQ